MNIGIDIGGTKIALALVDDRGTVHTAHQIPTTPSIPAEAMIDRIAQAVGALSPSAEASVGVGCAGWIHNGVVRHAINLGWRDVPLQALLSQRLGRTVRVENDVRAALIGEYRYGVARGVGDVAYMAIGTGLGVAALCDGRLMTGADGASLEVGQMKNDAGVRYELGASGMGLNQQAQAHGFADSRALLMATHNGDGLAESLVMDSCQTIAELGAWLCTLLNPRLLVLGGGMGQALAPWLLPTLQQGIMTRCADFVTTGLSIHMGQVAHSAVGASALVVG